METRINSLKWPGTKCVLEKWKNCSRKGRQSSLITPLCLFSGQLHPLQCALQQCLGVISSLEQELPFAPWRVVIGIIDPEASTPSHSLLPAFPPSSLQSFQRNGPRLHSSYFQAPESKLENATWGRADCSEQSLPLLQATGAVLSRTQQAKEVTEKTS